MNRPLTILENHNPKNVIGKIYQKNYGWFIRLIDPIPIDKLPNFGFEIIESEIIDGKECIKLAKIHELSIIKK